MLLKNIINYIRKNQLNILNNILTCANGGGGSVYAPGDVTGYGRIMRGGICLLVFVLLLLSPLILLETDIFGGG